MFEWSFYGRGTQLHELKSLVNRENWFFCRIQGRRRIGKTALLKQLATLDTNLMARLLYMQVPDSDEFDVVATFKQALEQSDMQVARDLRTTVDDFASMSASIGTLCRAGMVVVLDEFQYFNRAALKSFNSFLQAQVDVLRDTKGGGLFVLGSIHTEMEALLDDKGAPLYGRLTAQQQLGHWDFEDLMAVYRAQGLEDPNQWLSLWSFFEGVPKFYRDCYEQGLLAVPAHTCQRELLERMFLMNSSPLTEEAGIWFLREIRGRGVSILNFLAQNPGCTNGEVNAAFAGKDEKDKTVLAAYLATLTNQHGLVDRQLPVFSDSNSRNARYYIADNFLQGWLAVAKPARDVARLKPMDRAIEYALPRMNTQEGHAFEKLVRQLHVECSRKGVGDFGLTDINLGFWNRPRDASRNIEIDVVAMDADTKTVRFGSCKRSASAHDNGSLAEFDRHIEAFLGTKEGKRVLGWNVQKVCFSPKFTTEERVALKSKGYDCRDLLDYARLF
jgi:uncharacterized protein